MSDKMFRKARGIYFFSIAFDNYLIFIESEKLHSIMLNIKLR